jgi:hypothetical protein
MGKMMAQRVGNSTAGTVTGPSARSERGRSGWPWAVRAVVLLAALGALAVPPASAQPARGKPAASPKARKPVPMLPALPLSIAVAVEAGKPVVTDAWVNMRVREAQRLLRPHGVAVESVKRRALADRYAALEVAADRDALAAELEPKLINVFIARSVRDIDKPDRFIMGVRWRLLRNLRKDYVILSALALPTTLAHELGHYFGNPHSPVDNNIMSYKRSDPSAVKFNAAQGARMRQVVRRHLRFGRLMPVSMWRATHQPKS